MWRRLASGQSRFRRQMSIQPRGSKPVYALLSFLCFPFISRYSLRAATMEIGHEHTCVLGEEGGRGCVTGWSIRVSKVRLSPRIKASRRMYPLFEICISPLSAPIRGRKYLGYVRSWNRSILMEINGYSCFLVELLQGVVTKRRITRWFNLVLVGVLGLANSCREDGLWGDESWFYIDSESVLGVRWIDFSREGNFEGDKLLYGELFIFYVIGGVKGDL